MATQDPMSFIPLLGEERSKVLIQNLANNLIFAAASEEGARMLTERIGKRKIRDRTITSGGGRITYSRRELGIEKPWYETYQLRNLKKFRCVILHCEKGFTRRPALLKPLTPEGRVPDWY